MERTDKQEQQREKRTKRETERTKGNHAVKNCETGKVCSAQVRITVNLQASVGRGNFKNTARTDTAVLCLSAGNFQFLVSRIENCKPVSCASQHCKNME